MKLSYHEIELDVALEGIIGVEYLQVKEALNEHGILRVKFLIEEEAASRAVLYSDRNMSVVVREMKGEASGSVIFRGKLKSLRTIRESGSFYLYTEFITYTSEWDLTLKSQSFCNTAATYAQVLKDILSEYPKKDIKDEVTGGKLIPGFLLQYEETDWMFLQRLASHFSTYLITDSTAPFGQAYFGVPVINYGTVLVHGDYEMVQDQWEYNKIISSRPKLSDELLSQEMIRWRITSRKRLFMGEELTFNGLLMVVTGIDIRTSHGELLKTYELCRRKGILTHKKKNEEIFGMSLPATVKERRGNQVRVHLDIDPVYPAGGNLKYFTYAIESSSFYCMPELESRVQLYFPSHDEQDAIAVHAIRTSGGTNPAVKTFSDPGGSMMSMGQGSFDFVSGNSRLHLGKDGQIFISAANIILEAASKLSVGESEDAVSDNITVQAATMLTLQVGSQKIVLDGNTNVQSEMIIHQAEKLTGPTPTAGELSDELSVDDAVMLSDINGKAKEALEQMADQVIAQREAEEAKRRQEGEEKIWGGLKILAGVGIAVLVVATAGAAAPIAAGLVITASAAYGLAEIQEGRELVALADQHDTTSHANNFIKDSMASVGLGEDVYNLTKDATVFAMNLVTLQGIQSFGSAALTSSYMFINAAGNSVNYKGEFDIKNFAFNLTLNLISMCSMNIGDKALQLAKDSSLIGGVAATRLGGTLIYAAAAGTSETAMTYGAGKLLDVAVDIKSTAIISYLGYGMEYNAMHQQSVADPVLAVTGCFLIDETDFILPGIREPITLIRKYQSVNQSAGILGKGWSFTYEGRLCRDREKGLHVSLPEGLYLIFPMTGEKYLTASGYGERFLLSQTEERDWLLKDNQEFKTYLYQENGLLLLVRDQCGQELRFSYQGDRLKKMETPVGHSIRFTFQDGHLTKMEDTIGRSIKFHYKSGCLIQVTHMDQGVSYYEYSSDGYLIKATNQTGNSNLVNTYDKNGRVTSQTLANGDIYTFTYDDGRRKTIVHSSLSDSTTVYSWNREYKLTRIDYPDGTARKYRYDTDMRCIEMEDRVNGIWEWAYDDWGRKIKEKAPEGIESTLTYHSTGELEGISDKTGRCIRYEYDSHHNLTFKGQRLEAGKKTWSQWYFEYDRMGRLTKKTDPMGHVTTYMYEERRSVPSMVIQPDGQELIYEYDAAGRVTVEADSCGRREYGYDSASNMTLYRDGEGNETRRVYNGIGLLKVEYSPKIWDDKKAAETLYRYDFQNEKIDTLYPDGTHERQFYNGEGHLIKKVHPNAYQAELDDGEGICYDYDSDQNLIRIHYPDGGTERFFYDPEGRRVKHVLPEEYESETDDGLGYQYIYDREGHIIKVTGPDQETVASCSYDIAGNLTCQTNGAGEKECYEYDLAGRLVCKNTPSGRIRYVYDAMGHRIKEYREGEECLEITYAYDAMGRLHTIEDSTGAKGKYGYDCHGNKTYEETRISDTVSRKFAWRYDHADRLVEKREILNSGLEPLEGEAKEAVTTYKYDENGNQIQVITPEGYRISREYDIRDRLIRERVIDKTGGIDRITAIVYDPAGNIIRISRQGAGEDAHETECTYDLKNRITHVKESEGAVFGYEYDSNDQLVGRFLPVAGNGEVESGISGENEMSPVSQRAYRFVYDTKGRLKESWNPMGVKEQFIDHDGAGRAVSRQEADGGRTDYVYDVCGNPTAVMTTRSHTLGKPIQTYRYNERGQITGVWDGNGNETAYGVDAWGRVKETKTADGGNETYTYDYAGNVTSTKDGNGNILQYRYNSQGKVCEITDQEGNRETFRYDREGRLILHVDRNGNRAETSYNVDGKPLCQTAVSKEGRREIRTWEYNSSGQLKKSVAGGFSYTYQYRPDGKLLRKSSSGKTLVQCEWNADGSLKSVKDHSGETIHYEYDLCGRIKRIRNKTGKEIVSYRHTPGGRLAGIRYNNGIKTSYEYDTDGNIIQLRTELKDGEALLDFAYEYDGNGNRTAKTGGFQRLGEDGTYRFEKIQKDFQYDARNRLTVEATRTEEEAGGEKASGITYRYDPCGNRLEKVEDGEKTSYCYNNKNQLISRETKKGRWTYQYDHQGNLTEETGTDGNWDYHYDPLNRQEIIGRPDGSKIRNLYDGEGLRAQKQVNGKSSRYLFLNGEILSEMDESQKPVSHYARGYGVAAVGNGEKYNAVHQDESGSTVYVTGNGQEIHNSYEYDAFGVVARKNETVPNQLLYTGQQYDQESGQYYLRARFYNPVIGRFQQEDVYRGDGLNLYAYCENNPVVYYDPSGYNKTKKPNSQNSQGANATEEVNSKRVFSTDEMVGANLPSEAELNNAVNEWSRMQKSLAPSKSKITDFNTGSVVYDARTGEYYYGMNKGIKLSGDGLNDTLSNILPQESLNSYQLGNCAEVDAVNQALNNKANLNDLYIYTIDTTTDKMRIPSSTFGNPKLACENCTYTFLGKVKDILSGYK
ncbi:RHS repeat-associated core domain-containing protein [Lacrimispora xylanisolvens]|uniref:RHS repeat-associated core domain-containing protein n=1 Tax=Lacrimispora xylanisolvens TaxID=384636 RepID=UPI0024028882